MVQWGQSLRSGGPGRQASGTFASASRSDAVARWAQFAWAAPGLGAVHALEIPFVLDFLGKDARLFGPLLGDAAPQELADTRHAAWISFARSGDPGWPRYELSRRATMRFDVPSRVVDDPRSWERALWEGRR